MTAEIVPLPRAQQSRSRPEPLAFFVRVGRRGLIETPQSIKPSRYLDERVRRVSDSVALIAGLPSLDAVLQESLTKKQRDISRFRKAMAHLAEVSASESFAKCPPRRGG
jgi:hypothetical protein